MRWPRLFRRRPGVQPLEVCCVQACIDDADRVRRVQFTLNGYRLERDVHLCFPHDRAIFSPPESIFMAMAGDPHPFLGVDVDCAVCGEGREAFAHKHFGGIGA